MQQLSNADMKEVICMLRELGSLLSVDEAQGNATVCIDKMHNREFIKTDTFVRKLLVAQSNMGTSDVDAKRRRIA